MKWLLYRTLQTYCNNIRIHKGNSSNSNNKDKDKDKDKELLIQFYESLNSTDTDLNNLPKTSLLDRQVMLRSSVTLNEYQKILMKQDQEKEKESDEEE